MSEVEARSADLRAVGLDLATLFVPATEPSQLSLFDQRPEPLVDEAYLAFRQELVERCDLAQAVRCSCGVQARRAALEAACRAWWLEDAPRLVGRAPGQSIGRLRQGLVAGLIAAAAPVGLLDELELRAAGETWWAAVETDVRSFRAQGSFLEVLRGWGDDGDQLTGAHPVDDGRAQEDVMARWCERLMGVLNGQADGRLDSIIALAEHWWDKYRISLRTLEIRRSEAKARLDTLMHELGYV